MTNTEIIRSLIAECAIDSGLAEGRTWIATLLALVPMATDIARDDVPRVLIDGHRAGHHDARARSPWMG